MTREQQIDAIVRRLYWAQPLLMRAVLAEVANLPRLTIQAQHDLVATFTAMVGRRLA